MYKRQLRITSPHQIATHLTQLIGKKINIVLKDNTVIFGELVCVQDASLRVLNMRLKKTEVPIDYIHEIFIDVNA